MDFAALSKMAKEAGAKAKVAATRMAEQAKEGLEDTEGNKQMMQQFAEKVGRTLDEFIDEAPGPDQSKIIDLTYVTDRFVTMGFPASPISASRSATVPSRHRRVSCPSDEVVGGFFFEFEAVRTESSDRDAPRRSPRRSRVSCREGLREPHHGRRSSFKNVSRRPLHGPQRVRRNL